jgi:hypothetical protein
MSELHSINPEVEYRDFPGVFGYRIGNDGSVWCSIRKIGRKGYRGSISVIGNEWKKRKLRVHSGGYIAITIRGRLHLIHRVVLQAFSGNAPEGKQCCHIDGNRSNNTLGNLRWGTAKENAADREGHGNTCRGQRNGFSRFTPEDVMAIRSEYATGLASHALLAKKYGTSKSHIQRIIAREAWAHVVS